MAHLLQSIGAKSNNQISLCKRLMSYSLNGGFNFVEGVRSDPIDNTGSIDVLNPATRGLLCTIPNSGPNEVNRIIKNSKAAHSSWSKV